MKLKRKKVHPGMEHKTWSKIQTNNGVTIIIENDLLYDEQKIEFIKKAAN